MPDWRAALVADWPMRGTRLYAARTVGHDLVERLVDGKWVVGQPDVAPEGEGLYIPEAALPAIFDAMSAYQGLATHQSTEAKILREWLEVEKGRVDRWLMSADYMASRAMDRGSDRGPETRNQTPTST
jgi:hypothetical protein